MDRILTHGNVEVQNIRIGDIHYEYDYGCYIKVEVLTKPKSNGKGGWGWISKNLKNNETIDYFVTEGNSYYAPKLYDYEAYMGYKQV